MAMYERYATGFYSRDGVHWRCCILQEAEEPFDVVTLDPGAEPLIIEWPEKEKEVVVCSSSATLTVVSPGDRTLIDLYTIKVGRIRMDVYRNGAIYWSGTIDPEFYEEPYSETDGYEVSLTFSDFGILDRIPYGLSGRRSLRDLLNNAIANAKIVCSGVDETMISTTFPDGTAMPLSALSIPSENFFDEDGEAFSWRKVIDGIFQPLALKMIQRAGSVYVFDLNGLYTKRNRTAAIEWRGSDAKLGTDKVYNNIKVTFSPYSSSEAIKGELEYTDIFGPEWTNLTTDSNGVKYFKQDPPSGMAKPDCYSFYVDYDPAHRVNGQWDYDLIDFTIFRSYDSNKCKGIAQKGANNAFFKIQPVLGGQESEGIIGGFYPNVHSGKGSGSNNWKGISPVTHTANSLAFKTTRTYLPALSTNDAKLNYIRIQLPLLFDPRYNPFQSEGDYNEGANYEKVKSYCQFAFVPVAIVIYNSDGQALYHYDNRWLTQNGAAARNVASTADDPYRQLWGWKSGEAAFGDCWLSYYDPDDLLQGSGVLDWKTNRQSFGKPWNDGRKKVEKRVFKYNDKYGNEQNFFIFDSFKKIPEGQFIPYPPAGGYLEIRVYNGVWACDDVETFKMDASAGSFQAQSLYNTIRWQMYKLPDVTVVKANLTFNEDEIDDVEYSGVANTDAKESLELDTICGTALVTTPTAKGVFMKSSDGLQISVLKRAGRTDHPEQLLIGTLYSQYADRKTTLSGEASIYAGALTLFTERAQDSGTKFFIKGEEQNIREDISKATFVEVRPDEYTGTQA